MVLPRGESATAAHACCTRWFISMCSTREVRFTSRSVLNGRISNLAAVGGHIDEGETPEQALIREVREELGITDFTPECVGQYVFDSKREREYVYVNRTTYDGPIHPSASELDGGRFWSLEEIRSAIGQQILTPNFESEFQRFFL